MSRGLHLTSHGHDDDPLTKAMAPPPDETEEERQARLADEREAQRRSDAIDEELNRQRINEKRTQCVRILLLGQSESGKSTTLKNFQLFHSNKAFRAERASWRAVVQLNVVRSVRTILDAMSEAQGTSSQLDGGETATRYPVLSAEHLRLKMRLLPLQQVEEALLRKMTPAGSAEWEATHLSPLTNLPYSNRHAGELALNSMTPWKTAFSKLLSGTRSSLDSQDIDFDDPNDPGVILNACKDDITALWSDSTIQKLLQHQRIRLQDMGGFFLDQVDRVASLKYVPSDGNLMSHDWRIFDVGGARSLVRDSICHRDIVRSIQGILARFAWICGLRLLLNVSLPAKLVAGVSFGHFVVSYGDRPNDFESTSKSFMTAGILRQFSPKSRTFYCHLTTVTTLLFTHAKAMSNDVMTNFLCLDELTQVIYQGIYRFIVLSSVTDQWTINLGLSGPEGRWWRGAWTKTDILAVVVCDTSPHGSKSSDKLLETFAEKLAETLIQGELHVGDWSPEEGAKINLTLGPSSKKPLQVPLSEITPAEAASHATDVLFEIALQAQSRKCRLHSDNYAFTPPTTTNSADKPEPSSTATTLTRKANAPTSEPSNSTSAARPVKPLLRVSVAPSTVNATTVATDGTRTEKSKQEGPSTIQSAAPKSLKGASLANPNKKARKYQAIEFED
ncbi:hypothetical protein H0H93_007902 [Arthromyces matolae]|nr:hypothetical protein H0H93_007902 [Arthromyces matolae]